MRIRTKVRNASEADLVSAREAQGIEFRPTRDELLLLARTSTDRVTEALARRWSEHPDELVAMMFVRTHLGAVASNRTLMLREIHTRISERAVRDAEQGGDDWTPLLDVLVDVAGGDGMVRQVTGYEKRLRKLHAWIRRVSDPAELVPLAQLDSSAIRYAQLEIARTIPEELLAHWIQGGGDMMRVLRNDQLARRHAPALLLHLFELGIREVLELEEDIREIEPRWLRGTDQAYADLVIDRALGVSSEDPWTASYRGVLGWVIDKLPDIDPERIRSLVADTSRDFPKSDLLASLVLHPSAPPEIRRDLLAGKFGFGANLLMHACADAEFLRAAWRRGGEKAVEMIYLHPNTPADVAVQLIASWDGWREEIGVPPLAQHAEAAVMLATAGGLRKANEVLALYAASAQLDRRRGQESVIETALSVIVAHEDVGEDVVSHIEMLASRGALRISPALYARLLSDDDQVIRERLINSLSGLRPSARQKSRRAR